MEIKEPGEKLSQNRTGDAPSSSRIPYYSANLAGGTADRTLHQIPSYTLTELVSVFVLPLQFNVPVVSTYRGYRGRKKLLHLQQLAMVRF